MRLPGRRRGIAVGRRGRGGVGHTSSCFRLTGMLLLFFVRVSVYEVCIRCVSLCICVYII